MGEAENKALVGRFYDEVWVTGNLDAADEVFAPDYVRHDFRAPRRFRGPRDRRRLPPNSGRPFPTSGSRWSS